MIIALKHPQKAPQPHLPRFGRVDVFPSALIKQYQERLARGASQLDYTLKMNLIDQFLINREPIEGNRPTLKDAQPSLHPNQGILLLTGSMVYNMLMDLFQSSDPRISTLDKRVDNFMKQAKEPDRYVGMVSFLKNGDMAVWSDDDQHPHLSALLKKHIVSWAKQFDRKFQQLQTQDPFDRKTSNAEKACLSSDDLERQVAPVLTAELEALASSTGTKPNPFIFEQTTQWTEATRPPKLHTEPPTE